MKHSEQPKRDVMRLTKGHIYALIICLTVVVVSLIGTYGK
jgi:hypothetical protein